ncbi:MAG: hypothetical protein ABL951_05610 [Alphaproteobacteria bacterium]
MMGGSRAGQAELTVGGIQAAYEVAANPEAFAERLLRLAGAVKEFEAVKAEAVAAQEMARLAMAEVEDGRARIADREAKLDAIEKAASDRRAEYSRLYHAAVDTAKLKAAEHSKVMAALEARSAALADQESAMSAKSLELISREAEVVTAETYLKDLTTEVEARKQAVDLVGDLADAWIRTVHQTVSEALERRPTAGATAMTDLGAALADVSRETGAAGNTKRKHGAGSGTDAGSKPGAGGKA